MTCWYHSTPSKLCDACMREHAKAAQAEPSVPAWADMSGATEVHGSAAIDFATVDFSGDAKLAAVEALCGFAARMATPSTRGNALAGDWGYLGKILYPNLEEMEREVSDATDALRYALDNPGPDAKPFHQVMADWVPSGLAKDALFFGVDRSKYAKELRGKWVDEAPAPASHVRVGDRVLHRLDKRSGVMTVRSVVGRIAECVQLDGNVVAYDTTYGALQIVERGELR